MPDNTIYAYLKPLTTVPDNYEIILLNDPAQIMMNNDSHAIYISDGSGLVRLSITEQVAQYNKIVNAILDTAGFLAFFIENKLIVTKEQISEAFSNELADLIFSMKEYEFFHQLHVHNEFLFDQLRDDYEYKFECPNGSILIEDRSGDDIDASYFLCLQFEKDGLMPEDKDDLEYDWFECYDQERNEIEVPDGRVIRVMDLLEDRGYLSKYSIEIEATQPVLSSKYLSDYYILNLEYKNDNLLVEQIKNFLGQIGIFGGKSGYIHTYALINVDNDNLSMLEEIVNNSGGEFMSLEDGEGNCLVFNLSPEQIIKISQDYNINLFIYGNDAVPSTPLLYKRNKKGLFQSKPLETINSMGGLEEDIAPQCSDIWEDLYFNDLFKECLWNNQNYNWR